MFADVKTNAKHFKEIKELVTVLYTFLQEVH